ncbi:MAG: DUF5320 domain-containing protein [Candidatus Verstraetearchaeota archaeon]|nr:DUF5320 domain-containing protein [Candidatus Verstraetearchaeota archaeon]
MAVQELYAKILEELESFIESQIKALEKKLEDIEKEIKRYA